MLSVTVRQLYLLPPSPPEKGRGGRERTQKGRSSSSTALGHIPTAPLAASRSPALTVRPLTLPNFHAFFLEVLGAPLSVANSRPTTTPFAPCHGLFIRPLTDLVVVVRRLPDIDRRCEPCWLVVVVRCVLGADRCREVSR